MPRSAFGEPKWEFEHITTEDGLPSNTIETFLQDRRGFLWIGTGGGLARYDGYSFTVYRYDEDDPNGLSGDIVHDIEEDGSGDLWLGTNGGLTRFDPRTGRTVHFQNDPHDSRSLSHNDIFRLLLDEDGTLWLATGGGGLDHFDPRTGVFEHYDHDPEDDTSLGSHEVRALHRDRDGTLWVGTQGGGLNRFDPETRRFQRFNRDPADPLSLGDEGVWSLLEDQQGRFWVGLNDAGLDLFDRARGTFRHFPPDPTNEEALGGKFVFDLLEDREGDLWAVTHDRGLFRRDRSTGQFQGFLPDALDPGSLREKALTTIFEDRQGALWVGSFTSGIAKLDRQASKFRLYRHRPGDSQSLVGNHIQGLLEDSEGHIWVATDGDGLSRIDPATRQFQHFRHAAEEATSLSHDKVQVLLEDRQGTLWVGTWGRGLNRFDRETETFRRYVHDPDDPDSLGFDDVRGLHETPDGTLWVATTYGGLNRFDRRTEKFKRYLHDPRDPESLGVGILTVLAGDAEGQLWVGLWGGGLNLFDPKRDAFTRFQADPLDPRSISHNEVWAIYQDDRGRFWVGTSGGLDRFDTEAGTFEHFRVDDGLPDNAVHVVVSDASGDLWVGTGNGLCHFDPEERTCRNYDRFDGLQGQSWNDGGGLRLRSGEILLGGPGGLNAFFPEEVQDNTVLPPVVLTDFRLFNRTVPIGGEDSPLSQSITETETLTLRHDQSVLTFGFSALNYRHPEKNRYRFRLVGVDTDWNEVDSSRRFATYTTLDSGPYRFEVQGSNNDGVWNEEGRVLQLRVLPPFWKTWWFQALSLLLVGLCLWLGYVLRTARIRARNRALQQEVDERRRVERSLQKSNLELEARNAEMERYTYSVSHDLKNPLLTIRGFAGALRTGLERGDTGRALEDVERIEAASEKMQRLLDELLELSRVGRVVNDPEPIDLTELARETEGVLDSQLKGRGVELVIDPSMPTALGDRIRMAEVFQNLVANGVKFMGEQPHPRITIEARLEGELVLCMVEDNGSGVPPAYREKIFELFERLDPSVDGTGVGLALVRRIIEFHGGRIWVEDSEVGRGTRFHFTLPRAEGPS